MVLGLKLVESVDDEIDRPFRVQIWRVKVDEGPLPLSLGNELDEGPDVLANLMALLVRELDVQIAEEQVVMHAISVFASGLADVGSLELAVGLNEFTDAAVGLGLRHLFVQSQILFWATACIIKCSIVLLISPTDLDHATRHRK